MSYAKDSFIFFFQENKGTLAIICIIAMLTYVIGFALGLGMYKVQLNSFFRYSFNKSKCFNLDQNHPENHRLLDSLEV